ncbi:MAG: LamG domain-containing protein [Candidatus Micrarchaeota archaeon]|nr:LamG domain-containing protein [Candidatus Micrarchaeota archaeon]
MANLPKAFSNRFRLQSAMEYLMTYGWAILVIAIVLVALFEIGVFNPYYFSPKATPGACQISRSAQGVNLEGQCNGVLPKYAIQLSGTNYVNAGNGPSLNVTNNITVSAWINMASSSLCFQRIVSKQFNSVVTAASDFQLGLTCTTNDWRWSVGGVFDITASSHPTAGTWYNFVGTYNGSYANMYVNGQLISSTPEAGGAIRTSVQPLTIGTSYYNNGAAYYYAGQISNVQVYNTSLSATQVKALYQEGIGGAPISPRYIVGWWPLNGDVNDYSANGNNGQTVGAATFVDSWWNGYAQP